MEERLNEQTQHWNGLAIKYNSYFRYDTKEGKRKIARKVNELCSLANMTSQDVVLELGCGTGAYSKEFIQRAGRVYAIDLSSKMLEQAPKMNNVFFEVADAHHLPYADGCFDVVVGCYVLQYLDLNQAIPEIVRVLKPEGRFVFIEPNALNPIAFCITRWGLVRRLLHRPNHNTSFYSWELTGTFEKYHLDRLNTKSLEFLPNFAVASGTINQLLGKIPLINTLGGSLIVYGHKNGGKNG